MPQSDHFLCLTRINERYIYNKGTTFLISPSSGAAQNFVIFPGPGRVVLLWHTRTHTLLHTYLLAWGGRQCCLQLTTAGMCAKACVCVCVCLCVCVCVCVCVDTTLPATTAGGTARAGCEWACWIKFCMRVHAYECVYRLRMYIPESVTGMHMRLSNYKCSGIKSWSHSRRGATVHACVAYFKLCVCLFQFLSLSFTYALGSRSSSSMANACTS